MIVNTDLSMQRFMAASKVLGEETVNGANAAAAQAAGTKLGEQ